MKDDDADPNPRMNCVEHIRLSECATSDQPEIARDIEELRELEQAIEEWEANISAKNNYQ